MTDIEQQTDDVKLTVDPDRTFFKMRPVVYVRSVVINLLLYTAVYFLAYAIKFDHWERYLELFWRSLPWVLLIKLFVLYASRSFRNIG